MNIHRSRAALTESLGLPSDPSHRLSISAWQVQPAVSGMFIRAPETWVRCAAELIEHLNIPDDEAYLQLQFKIPEPVKTRRGRKTEQLVLMVRLETRQPDNQYRSEDYLFKLSPESDFPVTPARDAPKDTPIWRPIEQPLPVLELYK